MSDEEDLQRACLGIDFGSTFTRAVLVCQATNQSYDVEKIKHGDEDDEESKHGTYGCNEFTSYGCPFEAPPAGHVGAWPLYDGTWRPEHSWRRRVSLKYGMYVLSGASQELLDQYPHTSPLTDRKDDAAFVARVRAAMVELFTVVRPHVNRVCRNKGLRFDEIALSIPDQWDKQFQDVYEGIVLEVFGVDKSVEFITESEGLAHQVINENFYEIKRTRQQFDRILFLDFGGHSMSASLFHVALGNAKEKAYQEMGCPSGVGGGSELWEYIVGEEMARRYALSHEEKAAVLLKFARAKRKLGYSTKTCEEISYEDSKGRKQRCVLSPELIHSSWKAAFDKPLQKARSFCTSDSAQGLGQLGVVISGGSVHNIDLQKELREMFTAHNVTLLFTREMQSLHLTMNIANGAAIAIGNNITVAEFFRRGAAIGIQMGEVDPDGRGDPSWENWAALLTDGKNPVTYQDTVDDNICLKLICDPFFVRRPKDPAKPNLCQMLNPNLHSYSLVTFAKRAPGFWKFKASFEIKGGIPTLVLEETMRDNPKQRGRPKAGNYFKTSFQLYVDGGNNCMHIDMDMLPPEHRTRFVFDTVLRRPELAQESAPRPDTPLSSTSAKRPPQTTEGRPPKRPASRTGLSRLDLPSGVWDSVGATNSSR